MLDDALDVKDIVLAQSGDRDVREQLIADHLPLVRRVVRQMAHRLVVEHLDEYSIALTALDEAINRYKGSSQVPFAHFARIVIKHRLTDWYRRQKQDEPDISLSQTIGDTTMTVGDQLADTRQESIQDRLEVEESLLYLQAQTEQLGLSLNDLVVCFPQHRDTRLLCIRLARFLVGEKELIHKLMQTGRLPCKALAEGCDVPVKTIERNRPAIILLALLLNSDLQVIHSYIRRFEGDEKE